MPYVIFTYVGLPLATLLHCGVLWWIFKSHSSNLEQDALSATKEKEKGRTALKHVRTLRLGLFMSSFVYLIVVTSVTTLTRTSTSLRKRALGLLACYLLVAVQFWITALAFVPHFEQANLKYNAQITQCIWILQNLGTYSAVVTGLSGAGSLFCPTISWALMSILMDVPISTSFPMQLVELMLHAMLHLEVHSLPWAHCVTTLLHYSMLGLGLPVLCNKLTPPQSSRCAPQVPYPLFLAISVVLSTSNMLNLMLSSTTIAHWAQDNMARSWAAAVVSRLTQSPLGTSRYGYGLSTSLSLPLLLALWTVVALVRGFLAFAASQAWPEWRDWCMKHPLLSVLLQLILSLPQWKKMVLASLAGITVLQAMAMKGMILMIVIEGSGLLVDIGGDATLLFLPSILVALLLQFVAVGLMLIPAEREKQEQPQEQTPAAHTPTAGARTSVTAQAGYFSSQPIGVPAGSPAVTYRLSSPIMDPADNASFRSDNQLGQSTRSSHTNDDADCAGLVPVLREVALAAAMPAAGQVVLPDTMDKPTIISHLQEYTRGLQEIKPFNGGAKQFVGMANASVQALFPGVKYSSMSVLSLDNAQEVYITIILGAGMNQPKMVVKVVPCTLLVYVLDSGQAVFISNTDTFVGPFSDVQFMRMAVGLRAVACLPLLWRDGDAMQVYGAVLMGFPEPRTWSDEDKKYAKQLAMVLAEGIPLLDAEEPMAPYSPNAGSNRSVAMQLLNTSSDQQSPGGASTASNASRRPRSPLGTGQEGHNWFNGSMSKGTTMPRPASSSNLSQTDGELKLMEIIGRGGFGSVYKGIWHGQEVAVKVLEHGEDFMGCADDPLSNSHSSGGGDDAAAALSEGRMTLNIRHPNVVQTFDLKVVDLTSASESNSGPTRGSLQQTRIIMEFCDRGCLQDAVDRGLLHKGLPTEGGHPDMEAIALTLAEVASALAHLHSHNITHRDLKPKNILLKTANKDRRGFTTKVSDFGLSQVLQDNEGTFISTKYGGTITHMPPELLEEGRVYPMGDVYAFGIIMWEVYTGATPYANMVRPQIMVGVVTHNLRPKFPEACPEWYRSLAYRCWRKDPKQRPSFSHVTAQLQNILYERMWERA